MDVLHYTASGITYTAIWVRIEAFFHPETGFVVILKTSISYGNLWPIS